MPSSGSAGIDSVGGFQLPSEHGSSVQRNERLARLLEEDGDVFNINPGFTFDAEGNLIEEPIGDVGEHASARARSEAAKSEQVRLPRESEAEVVQQEVSIIRPTE